MESISRSDLTNGHTEMTTNLVGVAVPTYNEKANLQTLVDRLLKVFEKSGIQGRIVIVDDNSSDGTGRLADALAQKHGNISVIHRPGKLGLGSAYKEAFQLLMKDPRVFAVMEMDADLSHEPEYIPSLLKKIEEGYDVVVGSRYVTEGGIDENWAPMRRLISKSANLLTKLLVGIKVQDATGGFRAYDALALKSVDLSNVRTNGYAFQIDMLFNCSKAGCELAEVPIIFKERKHGKSKLGSKAILEFVRTLENSFATRIAMSLLNAARFISARVGNSFWIGLKPLREAIRETNLRSNVSSDRVYARVEKGPKW